jgi:hypothetical protein
MIADEMNRINDNKADYMAYSNQVFVNGNKFMGADDLLKLPAKLRPKYAEHRQPIDYTGGITHKNGEGYSAGMKFGSKFGEDMNRNKAAYMPKRLRCESSSESSSDSGSDSDSDSDDYDEEEVPSLEDLLEHLAGLKMDKKTHNDVVSYLHKMEGSGKGLSGRGSVWSWIKDKANKVADVAKKGYKFAEEKVKPIAKIVVPLLKLHPGIAAAIDKGKSIVSAIPLVGSDTKKKLEEYGLGKSGGAKRAPSKWVEHCRKWAADHSIKYGDAMKSPECRSAYKKSGGAISMANAKDLPPQSELTDVIQIGKGKKGRKSKSKIAASNGAQFLDTNENKMLGVPARAPGYLKSSGENHEGASLGAGVMGGPSNDPVNKGKITGLGLKENVEAAEAAAKSAVKGKGKLKDLAVKLGQLAVAKKIKKPAAPAPAAPVAPAPEVGGKKRKGKTGSALFKQKGQFPIEIKQSEPLTVDQERKSDYIPADEAKVLGQGKKPRAASAWINYVKKVAADKGISYKAAMSIAKESYKK